jgi:hypothetical protein
MHSSYDTEAAWVVQRCGVLTWAGAAPAQGRGAKVVPTRVDAGWRWLTPSDGRGQKLTLVDGRRRPDKREVGGSTPPGPIGNAKPSSEL